MPTTHRSTSGHLKKGSAKVMSTLKVATTGRYATATATVCSSYSQHPTVDIATASQARDEHSTSAGEHSEPRRSAPNPAPRGHPGKTRKVRVAPVRTATRSGDTARRSQDRPKAGNRASPPRNAQQWIVDRGVPSSCKLSSPRAKRHNQSIYNKGETAKARYWEAAKRGCRRAGRDSITSRDIWFTAV